MDQQHYEFREQAQAPTTSLQCTILPEPCIYDEGRMLEWLVSGEKLDLQTQRLHTLLFTVVECVRVPTILISSRENIP